MSKQTHQIHDTSRIKEITLFLGSEWELTTNSIGHEAETYQVRLYFKKRVKQTGNKICAEITHQSTPTTTNAWSVCQYLFTNMIFNLFETKEPTTHTPCYFHPYKTRFHDLFPEYYYRAQYMKGDGAYIVIALTTVRK